MNATTRLRRIAWGSILTLVILLASCAETENRSGMPAEGADAQEPASEFLEKPLGDIGVSVANVNDAALPFEPVVPEQLGSPVRIVANTLGPEEAAVAWVFDHATLGQFAVVERVGDWTEAGLKIEASPVPSPGCTSVEVDDEKGGTVALERCASNNSEMITLGDGEEALKTAGERFSAVTWIEPLVPAPGTGVDLTGLSLVIDVMGPASVFTPDQAIAAANQIVGNSS